MDTISDGNSSNTINIRIVTSRSKASQTSAPTAPPPFEIPQRVPLSALTESNNLQATINYQRRGHIQTAAGIDFVKKGRSITKAK